MYHHSKNEDLTDTFQTLAKSGKRTNIIVWAIQRKFLNSPKFPFKTKKKRTNYTRKAESADLLKGSQQSAGLQHALLHGQRSPRNEHGLQMADRQLEMLCR